MSADLAADLLASFQRLTQPDWCNAPQPGNWRNACMRSPGHGGSHAVRKSYRLSEAFVWDGESYPVRSRSAEPFSDLWSLDDDQAPITPTSPSDAP